MGSTKWISPAGRASARAASPVQRVRMSPADASSVGLRFTSIGCSTNGVELSVSWDGGAFALPPFLEFFARTNLVAGGWELVGWTQAEMGETNLDVVVGADRLPGGADTVPSAAFFSVTASDGLGDDWADDDNDGVPNAVEQARGTNPRRADTDGDGLRDGWEAEHGMDPRVPNDASDPRLAPDADPDNDGLANRRESELGTDPFQPDSDNDGLDDGWESRYADFGFDPLVPNVNGAVENTGPDEDLDGDGLTNREECEWGTDPGEPDTDRDGVSDGTEVAQSGDPADAEDGGRPNSRVLATLTLGDHSRSQSEKYCLTFTPVPGSGPGGAPAAISRISARYDGCAPLTVPLKPGWRYEVRLDHAGSDPAYTGTPKPDYDYTLEFSPKPESVLLDDPQGL